MILNNNHCKCNHANAGNTAPIFPHMIELLDAEVILKIGLYYKTFLFVCEWGGESGFTGLGV